MKAVQVIISENPQITGNEMFFGNQEKAIEFIKNRERNANFYYGEGNNVFNFNSLVLGNNWYTTIRAEKTYTYEEGSIFCCLNGGKAGEVKKTTYYNLIEIDIL